MMEQLWTQALGESVLLKRQENLNFFMNVVVTSLAGRVGGDDLLDEVLSLGQVKLQRDGTALDTGSPCRVEMDDGLVIVHV
jgi:hypothetical protein